MMQVSMGFTPDLNFSDYQTDAIMADNGERFLDGDHAVKGLDPMGVISYLDFTERNDQWADLSINECSIVPEDEGGSMMRFCNENSSLVFPIRFTAVDSILQRAGLNCPLLQRTQPCVKSGILTPEERTSWITRGLSLNNSNAKVLIREGKVSAMLSSGYGIMPVKELFEVLMDVLKEEHPERKLLGGIVSHEYALIDIDLGSSIGIESFLCELKRAAPSFDHKAVSVSARLQTSDVGLSCAAIHLRLRTGEDELRIGKGLKLKHADANDIKRFREEVRKVGSLIQEAEDLIEELGNTPIKYVVGCVKRIQMMKSWIPKKILDDMASDLKRRFPANGTAMDVFLLIHEIVDRAKMQIRDLRTYVFLSEECAKLMYLPFREFDYPDIG